MCICKKCNNSCSKCRCKINSTTIINSNQAGRDGLSAYQIAVLEGKYSGAQEDFPEWLKGEEGPRGIQGPPGKSITDAEVDGNGDLIITLTDNEIINAGSVVGEAVQGDSAYDVAVKNGFIGTEEDWLESLKGSDGTPGLPGANGIDGEDGVDGSSPEYRYSTNGSISIPPSLNNSDREPSGWSTIVPSSVPIGTYVWETIAIINADNTLKVNWQNPIRVTGIPGDQGPAGNDGPQGPPGQDGQDGTNGYDGPASVFRGDWDSGTEYTGSQLKVELVKHEGYGYITRTDSGPIPIGTLPTDLNYWNGPFANIDAIFTDFLFSYSAYIEDLTVGSLATGVEPAIVPDPNLEGERATIGFQPSSPQDPTSSLSRHSPRLYFPSGRIMMYQGWVDSFPIGDGSFLENKGVTIWFQDDVNSPIDYYISEGSITTPILVPPKTDVDVTNNTSSLVSVTGPNDPAIQVSAGLQGSGELTRQTNDTTWPFDVETNTSDPFYASVTYGGYTHGDWSDGTVPVQFNVPVNVSNEAQGVHIEVTVANVGP